MNRKILALALPNIVTNISIPLLGMVDLGLMGHLSSQVYVDATASLSMRNSKLISTLIIFMPAYYLLDKPIGNHGLWLALMLYMASRGIFLTLFARRAVLN